MSNLDLLLAKEGLSSAFNGPEGPGQKPRETQTNPEALLERHHGEMTTAEQYHREPFTKVLPAVIATVHWTVLVCLSIVHLIFGFG